MSAPDSPHTGGRESRSGNEDRSEFELDSRSYRSVFETMHEGVQILDSSWRYVYLNPAAETHARQPVSDLIGRTIFEQYPGFEDTDIFQVMKRCQEQRVSSGIENRFEYPDGKEAWFDLRINPVPEGIMVLSIDITDRKRVELDLRHSKESLGTMLECISHAVIATDTHGYVRRMNEAAEELVARTLFEAEGMRLRDLIRLKNGKSGEDLGFRTDTMVSGDFRIGISDNTVLVRHDGERIPVSGTGAAIRDDDDTLIGSVLVLRNVKEEVELLAMFQHAQKMEAVGQLAGGIAHDYNNMLTIILGYCEMLFQSLDKDSPIRKQVDNIHKAGSRAAQLTRKLLTFSRKQITDVEAFNPNDVLDNVRPLIRGVISEDIDIEIISAEDVQRILFDPSQLEQILINMVINARDAMPEGGRLTIKTANVDLDEAYAKAHPDVKAGAFVMLAVSDSGIGMSAETRSRVFEPFFTTKEKGKGTGLGLPMVYGLVKQAGGHIWVYSELGLGTTFKIYFPVAPAGEVSGREEDGRPELRYTGHETILLVEDDQDVRQLVKSSLEAEGFEVLEAHGGLQALERCAAHDGPIHVLLSDVVMPGMSGPDLGRAIRQQRSGIRMLFMSGYLGENVVRQDLLKQGDAFIEKPFSPQALISTIRELLD